MNYELAKQLKEAGFPDSQSWCFNEEHRKHAHWPECSLPTLEELVEACDGFQLVEYVPKNEIWQAVASDLVKKDVLQAETVGHGTTPTEAVANLWLALNKTS